MRVAARVTIPSATRRCVTAVLALACVAPIAGAQAPPRYRVSADTLRYTIRNPFRMYWVKGTDTTGTPQDARSVESHRWSGSPERPEVAIHQVSLDVGRRTSDDVYTIAPTGRVVQIDGRAPKSSERIDLLLHLPAAPLVAGTRWTDTVRVTGTDPGGAQWYEVTRSYRVARLVDTLGARRVAEIEATGTVRTRFGFWVDSAAGRAAWIDVSGPVTERYHFDAAGGRMLSRSWDMDLRGRGVSPAGPDTIVAGLRSKSTFTLEDLPAVRFLLARLPGADTSVTINLANGSPVLLHTTERTSGRISSSLVRNDGTVGVANVAARDGAITEYHATWADSGRALWTHDIAVRPGGLVMKQPGRPDTLFTPPAGSRWAVADYAMEEFLVPVLLAIPRDSVARPFAILRPYARRWDSGTVVAQTRGPVVLITLRVGSADAAAVVVLTPDGDYVYGETAGAGRTRRVPVDAIRRARLEVLLKDPGGG